MRSYREGVIQDADFADGIPEAIAWLGFSTRRNPLFLPPKTTTTSLGKPSSPINRAGNDIGLIGGGDEQARLRDAQDFVLDKHSHGGGGPNAGKIPKPGSRSGRDANVGGGGLQDDGSGILGPGRTPGGTTLTRTLRDRVRSINSQLADAQETMRGLEESLRSREEERDRNRGRAARVREAAAEAGRQKLAQRMYRLRGAAAVLEEGVESLVGEITAVRVRLFAERLVCQCSRFFVCMRCSSLFDQCEFGLGCAFYRVAALGFGMACNLLWFDFTIVQLSERAVRDRQ